MKKIVAVIGDARVGEDDPRYKTAYAIGKALVDAGYRIQTGGLHGVMEGACKGARASEKYKEGDVIAILPFFDPSFANEYADVVIPTGMDVYRNVIVANASAVVAVGGGAGTLSELASAWTLKRLVIGMTGVGGWSEKLAGHPLDDRVRYEDIPEDRVYEAKDAEEVIGLIGKYMERYDAYHAGIRTFGGKTKE